MSKRGVFAGILCFIVLLVVSETLYVVKNKWVYYSYSLKATKVINTVGRTDFAFYIATLGKYRLPNDNKFKLDVKENIKVFPPTLNLPVLIYRFALSAYEDNLEGLTPQLLDLCIQMDPDFSFWRVELANYYLLSGDPSQAKTVLDVCMEHSAPRAHCNDYLNSNLMTNKPLDVGFLKDTVVSTYKLYPNL